MKKDKNLKTEKKSLGNLVLAIFTQSPEKSFNYKQIAKKLGINESTQRQTILSILYGFAEKNLLDEIYTGKFKLHSKLGYVTGIVDFSHRGNPTIITDEVKEEIIVSESNLHYALHGDKVKVYLFEVRNKHRISGEVVEILERSNKTFVGTVEILKNYAFFNSDSRFMPYDIFIPLTKLNGATHRQKVVAQITDWTQGKNPVGEVVQVLGNAGENSTEMHAILAEFGLPYSFTEEIIKDSEQISAEITKEEILKRRDFRKIHTFTIDPEDAKDFDDALSFQKLNNGNVQVGIHIADVTHYVSPKSLVEKEARQRATSVYLVDRVVPMLPERLSNFLCSLRPNEDKLCFSAVFELNKDAEIQNQWFGKTIIHSQRRFTYQEAQEIIENQQGELSDILIPLHNLAQQLRKKRFVNGAIAFERTEVKFVLDENGKPLNIYFKENKESNQLIEEFMLLANRKVAEFIGKNVTGKSHKSFVYRVHDKPDAEKLIALSKFVKRFGYTVKTGGNLAETAKSINSLLDNVQGKNEQDLIETLAIRSMAKAIYTTYNIGHYGLAFSHYTHFTSPIRRYPDMMVHRLLNQYLKGEKSANEKQLEDQCKHSSDMEQLAEKAERTSVKYKQVEFMQYQIGKTFEGIISGITEWGIYVEIIENKVEGLIPVRDIEGDFYIYDEANYRFIGKYTKKIFRLGDKQKIEVVRTNLEKRQLDFKLVDEDSFKKPIKLKKKK